jgi:WD40 repeat protein
VDDQGFEFGAPLDKVLAFTISPDGSSVYGANASKVRQWRCALEDKACKLESTRSADSVDDLALSPDGAALGVTTFSGQSLEIWGAKDLQPTAKTPLRGGRLASSFELTAGSRYATGRTDDGNPAVWATADGARLRVPAGFLALSPDGTLAASSLSNASVRISRFTALPSPDDAGTSGDLDPRGAHWTYRDPSRVVHACDVESHACVTSSIGGEDLLAADFKTMAARSFLGLAMGTEGAGFGRADCWPLTVKISPDAKTLGALCDGLHGSRFALWDIATREAVPVPKGMSIRQPDFAFSLDGRYVGVAMPEPGAAGSCGFFELSVPSGHILHCEARTPSAAVNRLALGANGAIAVATDSSIIVFELDGAGTTLREVATYDAPNVTTLAFDHLGKRLLAGTVDGSLLVMEGGNQNRTPKTQAIAAPIRRVGVADDGKTAYALSDWWITRYDVDPWSVSARDAAYIGEQFDGEAAATDFAGDRFQVKVLLTDGQVWHKEVRFDGTAMPEGKPADVLDRRSDQLGLRLDSRGQFTSQ